MSPTERAAHSQAAAWNACWPAGSEVSVLVDDDDRTHTTTVGPAEVYRGVASIFVTTIGWCEAGPWPLDRVRPVHAELTAAAPLRGRL